MRLKDARAITAPGVNGRETMSRKPMFTALAAAVLAASPAFAATITPVAVTASNTFPFWGEYNAENLIDGSGIVDGLHDDAYTNMWMTDQAVQAASLTFDLGAAYDLAAVDIWNYNYGDPGFASLLDRGAKDFSVWLSADGVSYDQVFAGTLAQGTGELLAAQRFNLDGGARYVRLDLLNNYATDPYIPYTATGLSEVRFDGTLAAVPEPASWAMMIAGFGLTGAAMRRRTTRIAQAI
jgi:hypothetical protein